MKILFERGPFPSSIDLVEELRKLNVQLSFIEAPPPPKINPHPQTPNPFVAKARKVASSTPHSDYLYSVIKYFSLLSSIEYSDVVHLNRPTLYPLGKIIQKNHRTPVVFTIHNLPHSSLELSITDKLYELREALWLEFLRNSDNQVTAISRFVQKKLALMGIRSRVIYQGINPRVFNPEVSGRKIRQELNIPESALVILWVGYLDPIKDPHTFLKAIPLLNEEFSGRLIFIVVLRRRGQMAQGILPEVGKIRRSNVRLIILENISYHEMPAVYAACDVLVSTSLQETFGLAVVEAMACGKPAFVADSLRPTMEIVGNKDLIFKPMDEIDLCRKVIPFLEDAEIRLETGRQQFSKVLEHFTWHRSALEYLQLYNEVMK